MQILQEQNLEPEVCCALWGALNYLISVRYKGLCAEYHSLALAFPPISPDSSVVASRRDWSGERRTLGSGRLGRSEKKGGNYLNDPEYI
jgi:hypothetical protein